MKRRVLVSAMLTAAFALSGCGASSKKGKDQGSQSSLEDELGKGQNSLEVTKEPTSVLIKKEALVSFAKDKGLLPSEIKSEVVVVQELSDYTGSEASCAFYSDADTYVCIDGTDLYADLTNGKLESFHVRLPKHVRIDGFDTTIKVPVTICGMPFKIEALQLAVCLAASSAGPAGIVAACNLGTAVSVAVIAESCTRNNHTRAD